MNAAGPYIRPMSRLKRRLVLLALVLFFLSSIPVLYMYATGYRIDFTGNTNFVSTGGIFVSAEIPNVEIYIDNTLVRETRRFRKAFYAQNIDAGTHQVHVQKAGYHTWVKELPVYPRLVTEVQAFNLPLVPRARVITRFETATGTPTVLGKTVLLASSTGAVYATTSVSTARLIEGAEYKGMLQLFGLEEKATTTKPVSARVAGVVEATAAELLRAGPASTTEEVATTTKESRGIRLFENDGDVFADWIGSRENMPYYYCAEAFPSRTEDAASALTSTSSALEALVIRGSEKKASVPAEDPQVQQVSEDVACVPEIRIDRKWQHVSYFDFFPGTTDIVILGLEDGIYAVEIDNRSWQNVQPIVLGTDLSFRVTNGRVVVYDGTTFYEMVLELPEPLI